MGLRQVLRVFNLAEPAFCGRIVLAFFSQLREGQIGLSQAGIGLIFRGFLGQRNIAFQRSLGQRQLVFLQLQ